ncbi:hypothetical protein BCR33DRAFT_695723 [Rhizoclosmatium globosum]|uniref:Rhodanese domain-containing protein n=1 Tax=Rhizoclosmatium globosum TaxID=329046 RepID=A0A1Y2CNB9_9FUNG|nr:hypothetical protein BCR33DRAFT_695723 [Rhizoclosmatium globosum]|eukprot:ORY48521.1 hypothetical protein BCR33DRAFT_695723 [Rhizoclosmatium globosum]
MYEELTLAEASALSLQNNHPHEVTHSPGTVKGAINVHAQTFFDQLPDFVAKYKDVPRVFFFCNSSSQSQTKIGRGPRCAMWYQDAMNEQGITTSKALILAGGIKGWVQQYKGDASLVDRYDEEFWKVEHP